MEEKYKVVGFQYGSFEDKKSGETVKYCNLFCIGEQTGEEKENYHHAGCKAYIFKCVSPDLLKDLQPNAIVHVYFDKNKKACMIVPAK